MTNSEGESDERSGGVEDDEAEADDAGEAGDGGGTPSEDVVHFVVGAGV